MLLTSGNCAVLPKYGVSVTSGPSALTRVVQVGPTFRTVELGLRGAAERLVEELDLRRRWAWTRLTVHATIRPVCGTVIRPRFVPTLAW